MEAFRIADASINNGIFRPAGHDSVWIFITQDKTADRTQYVDVYSGDVLNFEGQTTGRTDDLIREHRERGLELLLFFADLFSTARYRTYDTVAAETWEVGVQMARDDGRRRLTAGQLARYIGEGRSMRLVSTTRRRLERRQPRAR